MQHDRKAGNAALDLFEDIEAQRRRLLAFGHLELVGAVAGADGDRQRIDAGLLDELFHLLRLGVGRLLGLDLVLDAGQNTELALDGDVELAGVFDDLPRQGDVLLEGVMRAVDHDRGEPRVDARLAQLEGVAVVEVQDDGDLRAHLPGHLHGAHRHVAQHRLVGVVAGALAHLDDDRRVRLGAGGHDRLELLEVVEVVGRNGVAAVDGFLKQFTAVHQAQFRIVYSVAHK